MLRRVWETHVAERARAADARLGARHPWTQFAVFSAVGIGNVLVDAGVFALVVLALGWRTEPLATVASVLGFVAGAAHSYFWNSSVTFGRGGRTRRREDLGRFALSAVFGAALSALLFSGVMSVMSTGATRLAVAKLVATAGSMVVNFLVMRHWVFSPPPAPRSLPAQARGTRPEGRRRAWASERTPLRRRREAPALPGETRPWGAFAVLATADDHQVKRLEVSPGRRLSYQTHRFRSEHWHVVSGTGRAILDGEPVEMREGLTVDVGIGVAHRIENTGDRDLVLIEVQRGTYFGEDDIVRLDDDYGRGEVPAAAEGAMR